MRIELNLASQPFGGNRLFWAASGAAGLILLAIAVALVVIWAGNREPAPELVRREAELRVELSELRAGQSRLQQAIADPANDAVLRRSLFLNQLLRRKGISWTQTFADLEKTLPPRVLMMQIRPQVTAANRVWLDMHVGAETPEDFIEFLKVIESSEMFGNPTVRGSSPPTENQPLFRYQLAVTYDQQLD